MKNLKIVGETFGSALVLAITDVDSKRVYCKVEAGSWMNESQIKGMVKDSINVIQDYQLEGEEVTVEPSNWVSL